MKQFIFTSYQINGMSIKKNPVLIVLVILAAAFIVLGTAMYFISGFFSSNPSAIGFSEKIGVIEIAGQISDSSLILDQLNSFSKNKHIKAIVLRIDSPGGAVGASQEIYREVLRVRESKKVIVSMGDTAASGGYYIAAAGDKIVANPGTITGSIGVIMSFYRIDELSKKIGLSLEVIKSGEFKDTGSSFREMTDREKELMNQVVLNIQEQFIKAVAEGRNLPVEKVRGIADGRIFSGEMAMELGLVDELGNFQDAVNRAAELSGIKGEPTLVYPEKAGIRLWDLIFQSAGQSLSKAISEHISPVMEYRWSGLSNN
jgi:protease IV